VRIPNASAASVAVPGYTANHVSFFNLKMGMLSDLSLASTAAASEVATTRKICLFDATTKAPSAFRRRDLIAACWLTKGATPSARISAAICEIVRTMISMCFISGYGCLLALLLAERYGECCAASETRMASRPGHDRATSDTPRPYRSTLAPVGPPPPACRARGRGRGRGSSPRRPNRPWRCAPAAARGRGRHSSRCL
jgi:hypothetical protein